MQPTASTLQAAHVKRDQHNILGTLGFNISGNSTHRVSRGAEGAVPATTAMVANVRRLMPCSPQATSRQRLLRCGSSAHSTASTPATRWPSADDPRYRADGQVAGYTQRTRTVLPGIASPGKHRRAHVCHPCPVHSRRQEGAHSRRPCQCRRPAHLPLQQRGQSGLAGIHSCSACSGVGHVLWHGLESMAQAIRPSSQWKTRPQLGSDEFRHVVPFFIS